MNARHKNEMTKRLSLAFDLFGAGCEMMEKKLRREHPAASEEAIERWLGEWLHARPGAELGDAMGSPGSRSFSDPQP